MGLQLVADELKEAVFERIRLMVYEQTGIKLTSQKRAMVQARLMKRLKEIGCPTFEQYVKRVSVDHKERSMMYNLITTNVTTFFRENHHFNYLVDKFLLSRVEAGKTDLKIWSAGCSTGQEPYSLAITLNEASARQKMREFCILATDINTEVLKQAANGVYCLEEVRSVPYPLLTKYFKLGQGVNHGLFKIKDSVRTKVSFRHLNLVDNMQDFNVDGLFDCIFCRNVFIYFDRDTKARVIKKFYKRLAPGGLLFLGHSESLDLSDESMGLWSLQMHTVYRKEEPGYRKK